MSSSGVSTTPTVRTRGRLTNVLDTIELTRVGCIANAELVKPVPDLGFIYVWYGGPHLYRYNASLTVDGQRYITGDAGRPLNKDEMEERIEEIIELDEEGYHLSDSTVEE